jgi:tRNA modification GTPase
LPQPRAASFRRFRDEAGELLDEGLALWFPGPRTATGEDLAELHLHGGRAVVAAIEGALARCPGVRRAEAGEFTRRAFANGRIDLAEAEGLADLLAAETELQRRAAITAAGGTLSRLVEGWRERLLALSAQVEAALDFADEDEAGDLPPRLSAQIRRLSEDLAAALEAPAAETLREGYRVALAGPPNAGKSTLFNALVESEAAIATPLAGTTRDVLERVVALAGVPFTFVDMAGLHEATGDAIEAIGIARAYAEIERADLVLWLGAEGAGPAGSWELETQVDRTEHLGKTSPRHRVSAVSGEGLDALRRDLIAHARSALVKPGLMALNRRQRELTSEAQAVLAEGAHASNLLIRAEHLRLARVAFDRLLGRTSTEDVLDVLFGRFCIGK